jgi:hypothetical protein
MLGLGHKGRLALRELGFTRDRQPVQKLKLLTNSSLEWNSVSLEAGSQRKRKASWEHRLGVANELWLRRVL